MILILDINTKDLDEEIVEYLKRNLIMRFNRDDAIILDPKKNYDVNMKIFSTNHLIRFTIRKILKAYLKAKGKTRKTPQETIELILSVSLPGIIIEKEDFD